MGTVFADTNRATARVLAHNGSAVETPATQQCCGALQVHSGQLDLARDLARRNIDAFESAGAETIIVNAAGCGSTLKEYGHLLKHESGEAGRDLSGAVSPGACAADQRSTATSPGADPWAGTR
jgi:glycolate oxidase iron-sulfur subunit